MLIKPYPELESIHAVAIPMPDVSGLITSNPLVVIKHDHLSDPNYQSLKAYLNSLEKLSSFDVQFVFRGHGEYMKDLPGIIGTYKTHIGNAWNWCGRR
jgi:hypothetical protein